MVIKIGTDCSGIEAPIEALKQLNIPFEHTFSCEKDPYALQSIKANYEPQKIYTDITKRKHSLLPDIDVYVCGFPCQPFSLMGNKLGTDDSRSNIMFSCIKVIQRKLPKIFILENVKNFKFIQKGAPFNYLIKTLKNIKTIEKECACNAYNVYYDILNTKDYGIPQNRERIFIIGIRKDVQKEEYTTPDKIKMKPLDDFILDKTMYQNEPKCNARKIITKYNLNLNKNYIISCSGFGNYMYNCTPTITCSTPLYSTKYKRYLTYQECLLLQGFNKYFKKVVSNTQMIKQIGNSMSVNVLKALFKKIFKITNVIT
jgi:DNA (cytosine-5)-methyltransferase 1